MNRIKNGLILLILISFLFYVAIRPVACLFKTATGICCPACGMTRAFINILHFNFIEACHQNILSIPLFLSIIYFIIMLSRDFIKNRFYFIPKLLNLFERYKVQIIFVLFISFVINNKRINKILKINY